MIDLKDGIKFYEKNSDEWVLFNAKTFFLIVSGCMQKYCGFDKDYSEQLIRKHYIYKPCESYSEVVFLSHEFEYHWAMIVAYGEGYWQKDGMEELADIPKDYDEWEYKYKLENQIENESFKFSE